MDFRVAEEIEGLQNIFLENLSAKYNCIPSKPDLTVDQLRHYNILEDIPIVELNRSFDLTASNSLVKIYLVIIENVVHGKYNNRAFYDSFCMCSFPSSRDFGRTIIRTEKFLDKLAELFSHTEFNIPEFEEFSSKYYCLSNQPEKLKKALDKDVASLFQNFKLNIGVEFNNNLCLLKVPYSIREYDKNVELVDFALGLQKLIG